MNTLIPNLKYSKPSTLNIVECSKSLLQITLERLAFLTPKEHEILKFAASIDNFSNQQLSRIFQLPASNISRMLKKFQEYNLVYVCQQLGKYTYYRVSEEIRIIRISEDLDSAAQKKKSPNILEIFGDREFTAQEYQNMVGMGASTVRRYLKKLVNEKKVAKLGKGRATRYRLIERPEI